MNKKSLNLSINEKLIIRERNQDINISSFFELKLRGYLALIEGKNNNHKSNTKDNSGTYSLVVMTSPSQATISIR
jgi:hypothetical protein